MEATTEKKKKKTGPKPFKDRRKIRKQVGFKLTDAEKKAIQRKAKKAKMGLSDFVRMRALAD